MAVGDSYDITTYRLRAGSIMPVMSAGQFVVHTFMAEQGKTEVFQCISTLPSSSDFRGQGGNLISANFARLSIEGGKIFQGKKVHNPIFVEEDAIL